MTVSYFEENWFQISLPAIYRQAKPLMIMSSGISHKVPCGQYFRMWHSFVLASPVLAWVYSVIYSFEHLGMPW